MSNDMIEKITEEVLKNLSQNQGISQGHKSLNFQASVKKSKT